ncbi:hypothetical protein [Chitinophaga varians]|uniref:hypothetical protein n=1 Tax=Chitinophaga varians TaxID=2202339 RepID=UPI00165ED0B9|nr:hypothetical protein [Chitinophaga varians]MBC9910103.1 hypothetical protein [Chitinophaga varians]
MKKISTVIAAVIAIIGIGGAYASTTAYHGSTDRIFTVYKWYTPDSVEVFDATIDDAILFSGCNALYDVCLIGKTNFGREVYLYRNWQ